MNYFGLIALSRTSSKILNRNGKCRHPHFEPSAPSPYLTKNFLGSDVMTFVLCLHDNDPSVGCKF